jgi:protein-S-isoprenylcysteine O-methyltransferase Ste14
VEVTRLDMLGIAIAAVLLSVHVSAEAILRRGRGKQLTATRWEAKSTVLVTSIGFGSLAAAAAARLFLAWGRFAADAGVVVAISLAMLAGVALRYWSMWVLGEFFTRTLAVFADQAVVSAGPYRWVRHPGYLAQIVVVVSGSALFSLSLPLVGVVAVSLLAAYSHRIRAEERMLVERFGEAYQRYRECTWRLVPFVY